MYSKKIDDNRLLLTGSGYKAGEDELSFCYIAVTDYQLNPILDPIDIGSVLHSKPADFRLESVNKDFFIVLVRLPEGDGKYVVLDYTGKKISEYKVRTEDFQKVSFGRRAAILGDNQFVYVDIEFLSNKYQLNFYINNSTNEMVLKKSVVTTSENDRITLMQLGITPDKNILLNFIHNNYTLNLDPIPNWSLWTLFDPVELGLTTSTKDEHITNKLTLYPNPTTNTVTIATLDAPAKVEIYDLNGSLVQSVHNVTSEVNIGNLPSGVYILNIKNNQLNERHKIIKME
ncbi:MAG: T9SS type A sorting domain-containing protein [Chitinophagales bacterium]|nr:T9SS type A sorting domain-containing protein [Chitinophagales bacterium]